MTTATAASYQRAINRARAKGGARRVADRGDNQYHVAGLSGAYNVTVAGASWRCDCAAGLDARCCWHLAAVHMFRLAQAARGPQVTTPAPAKAPLPRLEDLYGNVA